MGVTSLALLLGSLFGLGGLGSTAVAVVLPQAAAALDISVAQSSWFISLYVLTMAISTPIYGRLVDMYGVRVPLLSGVILMSAGAIVAALSDSFGLMAAARLLQGLGTGVGITLSVAVINTRFTGADRTRGLGIAAGVAAAIGAAGPLIGGLPESLFSWRGTTALPAFGLVLLALLWRRVSGPGTGSGFDIPGAVLVAAAAAGVILLLQSASSGLTVTVLGAALTVLAVPLVVIRSRRGEHVFLPSTVLMNHRLVRTCLITGTVPAAWFALLVAVPSRLGEHGWEPATVGLVLLPSTVVALAVPRVAPRFIAGIGRVPSLSVAAGVSLAALLVAALGVSVWSPVLMVAAVAMVSGAFSLGQPVLFAIVADLTELGVRGVATGFATLVFLTCGSAGSAVVGGFSALVRVDGGLLILAGLVAVGFVASLLEVRRTRGEIG